MVLSKKEIKERSTAISRMGYWMMAGFLDMTADNECLIQTAITVMMEVNESDRRLQEKILSKSK